MSTMKTVKEITALFEDKKLEKEFKKIKEYKVQGFEENYFNNTTTYMVDRYIDERIKYQVTKLKEI